jgi:hypothetical protein
MRRLLILAALLVALPAAAQTYRAAVVTPWLGVGTGADPYRPKLATEYALLAWDDVTGQPVANLKPSPNAYTLEVQVAGETLDLIEDDADYVVLWTEQVLPEQVAAASPPKRDWIEAALSLLSPREAWAAGKVKPVKPKATAPTAAERTALRAGLKALGYTTARSNELIRAGVARSVIAAEVIAAQKVAPKGGA